MNQPSSQTSSVKSIHFESQLAAFAQITLPVWIFDMDYARICWANVAALELWEAASLAELTERDMSKDMSSTMRRRMLQYREDFSSGKAFTEVLTFYPKGQPHTYSCTLSGIRLEDNRLAMLNQALPEIRETPDALRGIQALLRTSVMISLYDFEGVWLYGNPAARASRHGSSQTLEKRFCSRSDHSKLMDLLKTVDEAQLIAQVKTAQGERTHEIDARCGLDAVTGASVILLSETDVTERRRAEQKVEYLALHDVLTGLPNRSFLQQHMQVILDNAHLNPDSVQQNFVLFFIDLDRFKNINDTLGHIIGDKLLCEVAQRLRHCLRPEDFLARLGGDEFVIALNHAQQTQINDPIARLATRIQQSMHQPFNIEGHELGITTSIGISRYPDDGETLEALMKHADLAMYEAKDAGRDQYKLYLPEMNIQLRNRLSLEQDLRSALDKHEFELFYQPRLSLPEHQIIGAEALLRWRHPIQGLLEPAKFIVVAEETGLIELIGEWVLTTATRQQKYWQTAGFPIKLSINLSARQLHDPQFVPFILRLLEKTGGNPQLLELEITESMLLGNDDQVVQTLQALHSMGFSLAIDDFGTGYSNLAYLQNYPITSLKIDRSFIANLTNNAIVELIIAMCKLLDVTIVAEGVEHKQQIDWLQTKGCHEYQGFLFKPPLPIVEFEQLLRNHQVCSRVSSSLP